MGVQTAYLSGDLAGYRYKFLAAGERIPEHSHGAETAHNVICLSGSVRLNDHVISAGQTFDFDWSLPHTIVALEPATILNLYLFGRPSDFNPDYSGDF
jgi:hypothetical protein